MAVNGRRFLYSFSIGLYHRGPLSPQWKIFTQKPALSFWCHLPPPGFSISQPPSLSDCVSSWLQQAGAAWTTWLQLFRWQLRKDARTEGRKQLTAVCLCWFAAVWGSDITAGHTSSSMEIVNSLKRNSVFLNNAFGIERCVMSMKPATVKKHCIIICINNLTATEL